jgi:cytosine/adenosine deaminase-related metal-dependent hydrolase
VQKMILKADTVLVCDNEFSMIKDGAVVFDKKIIDIGKSSDIEAKYDFKSEYLGKDSLLMPSLINPHVHLEFSANKNELNYGDFTNWLKSVIATRDKMFGKKEFIKKALKQMIDSGVGTIGEISSSGSDLEILKNAPIRVCFFNEAIGSGENVNELYKQFLERFEQSQHYSSDRFYPLAAIHSPYSISREFAKRVIEFAKSNHLLVSTHFLESEAEREWLDKESGSFLNFFLSFLPNPKRNFTATEFIEMFEGVKTLFVHLNYATSHEIDKIQKTGDIIHCPTSNRLLGNRRLEIEKLDRFSTATDGLSSNNSLNIWDELRNALMIHQNYPIQKLAKKLLLSVTKEAALSLGLNNGILKVEAFADFAVFNLKINNIEQIALDMILHTKSCKKLYIAGNRVM